MKIYLASGWFTVEQERHRWDILEILELTEHEVFSPKEDNLWQEGDNPHDIFKANLNEIESSDIVIASTIGKDMGTIFECGYAYSEGIPVVYYAPGLKDGFNLMLAQSAKGVVTSQDDLYSYAILNFPDRPYTGGVE